MVLIGETVNQINQIKSNQMLVFEERGKPEFPEKNLSEQSREPTNSAHIYDTGSGNQTQDTLVEDERSHHCANPAHRKFLVCKFLVKISVIK